MTIFDELRDTYQQRIDEAEGERRKVQQQTIRISVLRLVIFLGGLAALIYFWEQPWAVLLGIACATVIPFACLMKFHNKLFYQKDYLDKRAAINRQELAALNNDFSAFPDGQVYADPSHDYTYDLDVFGEHSLFQCVNRTVTQSGEELLAGWMKQQLKEEQLIGERQKAVKELADELEFRQRFRISGLMYPCKANEVKELTTWIKVSTTFRRHLIYRLLPPLVTLTNVVCILGVAANVIPASVYGMVWVACIIASSYFTSRITRLQAATGQTLKTLSKYTVLLQLIEHQPMKAKQLATLKKLAMGKNNHQASRAIHQLQQMMNALDQRNNVFMYMILNGCFFWELRQMMRIERWKEQHAENLPQWIDCISEADALNSLATFAYNHPDYHFPTFSDQDFCLEAKALGHPLMSREQCVRNDLSLCKRPFFIIITGANMAGKSTYLRTIGTNYLLACIGAPVCAETMVLTPKPMVTSLRTTDSLNENESYFFAELKRLKMIIDKLKNGEELFIILDEILKGTNSMDKQKGSDALIRQFIALRTNGIIATHDLMLGELTKSYPEHIRNYCFEADITNNELTFSYKLRPGVAQNMNACFLMKKMGIAIASE